MKPSSEGLTSGLLALGGQDPSAGGQLGYWLYSRRWTVLATDGWALPVIHAKCSAERITTIMVWLGSNHVLQLNFILHCSRVNCDPNMALFTNLLELAETGGTANQG